MLILNLSCLHSPIILFSPQSPSQHQRERTAPGLAQIYTTGNSGKLTWNRTHVNLVYRELHTKIKFKTELGRWFSFSIGWFLGFVLIFQGVITVDGSEIRRENQLRLVVHPMQIWIVKNFRRVFPINRKWSNTTIQRSRTENINSDSSFRGLGDSDSKSIKKKNVPLFQSTVNGLSRFRVFNSSLSSKICSNTHK